MDRGAPTHSLPPSVKRQEEKEAQENEKGQPEKEPREWVSNAAEGQYESD